MKFKILCSCAVFAFAVATTSAQMKSATSGTCAKPDVQTIPAGDHDGHVFMLGTGKCESKGEIGGAMSKEGAFAEHSDATATHTRAWGVYVETFDSGDKIFYTYQSTGAVKGGMLTMGSNKYQITGGTGKMKGIKGSGTCKLTGTPDGGLTYDCTGEYTIAGAAAKM